MAKQVVGIQDTFPDKWDPISDVYRRILEFNGIDYVDLNLHDLDFWKQIPLVDCFIYRMANTDYHHQIARTVLPVIEYQYRIPCFPNYHTWWHYDDKIRQYYLLKSHNYPVANTYIFWDKDVAYKWIENAEFPVVFKLKSGSGSLQVKLVKNKSQARRIVSKMFGSGAVTNKLSISYLLKTYNYDLRKAFRHLLKPLYYRIKRPPFRRWYNRQVNYAYFQEFLPNTYDIRVQITGKRAYAFIRHNRPKDFRASGSNDWDIDHNKIDMRMVETAFRISNEMGFQSMAYDFVYNKNNQPVILEISYCFGDYPEFSTGYWDENLNWHEGHFLPQYFELVDLLGRDDLKLPEDLKPASSYSKVKV